MLWFIVPFGQWPFRGPRCSRPPPHGERSENRVPGLSRGSDESVSFVEGEVGLEAVAAALAAEARLLVAAERGGRGEAVEGVRPDDAGAQALGHPEDARALLGPDAGAQAVGRVVRLLDRLGGRAE